MRLIRQEERKQIYYRIPLTLAIIQALLVKIGSEKYAYPAGLDSEIENVKPQDIRLVRNRK